ncbi:MAG TPA: glycosyl hydrolase family 28-related protein [Opitutaceae bacterium]|jgi:hypothetical protein|nr:glycosyl hydrolase family 28-related protein [Opitutaceae bacterium]
MRAPPLFLLLAATASAGVVDEAAIRIQHELQAQRQRLEAVIASVGTRLPAPSDAVDVTKGFGVPADGSRDAAAPINRAMREAHGRALYFPPGTYLLMDSIRPVSGSQLYFSSHAEMRRGFNGGNGDGRGALVQGAFNFSVADVTVVGGVWTNPDHACVGRVLTAIGSRWTIDSLRVTSWAPAQGPSSCVNLAGDDLTLRNCVLTGSAGKINQDGIRVMCGAHIRISDCYVESGDDCFCAFPTEFNRGPLSGRGLSDVAFERCFGASAAARFLACGETAVTVFLHQAAMDQLNAVPVSGIRFAACRGMSRAAAAHAPAFFVVSADTNSGASVANIKFVGCVGLGGRSADQGALINAAPGARCADITLEQCEIFGGRRQVLTVTPGPTGVRIVACRLNGVPSR